jgi:hypothetical protein
MLCFAAELFDFRDYERTHHMSQAMVVKYFVTKMRTNAGTNAFLHGICQIAEEFGGDQPQERKMERALALFIAIASHLGSRAVLNMLLERHNVDDYLFPRCSSTSHPAALSIAVALGDISKARELLDEGADPGFICGFGLPLAIASNTGHFKMAEMLLEKGPNVNNGLTSTVRAGMTPKCALHAAALAGNDRLLRLLLKAKYRSVSSSVVYENAIYYAAMGGHGDVV